MIELQNPLWNVCRGQISIQEVSYAYQTFSFASSNRRGKAEAQHIEVLQILKVCLFAVVEWENSAH